MRFEKLRELKKFTQPGKKRNTRVARFIIFGNRFSIRIFTIDAFEKAFEQAKIQKMFLNNFRAC